MFESILTLFALHQPMATNYQTVTQKLAQYQASNPTQVEQIVIGINNQGEEIKGLKIGNGPTPALVVATHHGNEYGSTAVALGVAESFSQNPLPNHTVYLIPVLNISGYNKGSRYENGAGQTVDSNRDYPSPCKTGQNFLLRSTDALARFIDEKNIVVSATLHTHWPAVLYPWGISTNDLATPHDEEFIKLSRNAVVESGYQYGNSTELLYAADGTFEDYAYWKHGVWSLLFELGFSHYPDSTAIQTMVRVNVPGIRRFIETAPTIRANDHGFKGQCDQSRIKRIFLE